MESWLRSLALVGALVVAMDQVQAGPRAAACPNCPSDAIFLDNEWMGRKFGWIVGNDRTAYFTNLGWRDPVEVWAKRETPTRLAIQLSWTGNGGKRMVHRATVLLGGAVTIWSRGEQDISLYGGVARPLTLTWAE